MPLAFGVSRNPLASHSFAAPGHRGRGVECRLAYRQLNPFSPVDARCLQFTFAAACGHLFARDWHQRLEKTRVFEPPITLSPVRHRAPRILLSSAGHPFSAAHFPGHASGQIPAPGTFEPSAFPPPPKKSSETPLKISCAPPEMQSLGLGAAASRFWVPQKNGAEKGDIFMSYLYVKWNSFGRGLLASG